MNLRNAIQQALSKFEPKEILYAAFLGKADKTLRVTGKSGWMYCRMWNGEVVEAYNLGGVPASPGLAVNLAFRQGRFYILPKDVYKDLVRTGVPDGIEEELQFPGTHTLYVRGEQFLPGLVYPKQNLILSIGGGAIPLDAGGYIQVQPDEVDMSAYLPISGALWATIELTQAGSVTVTTGGAKPAMNELDLADVPITDGAYPLAAVRLRFGQSNIAWGKYKNDIVDLRWFRKGSGGFSGDPLRVVYTDSAGTAKTSNELAFNEADDTLTIGDPVGTGDGDGSYLHTLVGDKAHAGAISSYHAILTYAASAAKSSLIKLISSLGTKASPLAVALDTILGRIQFYGYDGDTPTSDSAASARIQSLAAEGFTSSKHGTKITVATTPNGSTTMQDVAEFGASGQVKLNKYGTGTYTGTAAKNLSVTSSGAVIESELASTDGWIPVTETWTYASASTITVPTNATTRYQKGVKIRFKQGGSYKYYVGKTIAATLITVFVNTDYVVANSAITDIAYSFGEKPYGFPDYFRYTPTFGNVTIGNGKTHGKYQVFGEKIIQKAGLILGNSTSITGSVNLSALASPAALGTTYEPMGDTAIRDTGTAMYRGPVYWVVSAFYPQAALSNGTYVSPVDITSTVPMTWTAGDELSINCLYSF